MALENNKFERAVKLAGLPIPESNIEIIGSDPIYYSPLRVGEGASIVHALVGSKIDELWQLAGNEPQKIKIDIRHAAATLNSMNWLNVQKSVNDNNEEEHSSTPWRFINITRIYRCGDGRFFHLHNSFNDGKIVAKELGIDVEADVETIAKAMMRQKSFQLEESLIRRKVTGVVVRSAQEWLEHPQGKYLATKPVVQITKIGDAPVESAKTGTRPLSGLHVLDLTRVLAGPTSARTLAEHGAQVVHVSSPNLPTMGPAEIDTGYGKRQIHLDLNEKGEADTLTELVKGTDVFNQGFRKGSLDRRGFGPKDLAQIRPGIIYVSENCFGHQGPWDERPGWEQLAQAASGIAKLQGELAPLDPDIDATLAVGKEPTAPRLVPAPLNDYSTAYFAAYGVLEALRRRATEGGSWHVQISLTQTAMWYLRMGLQTPDDLSHIVGVGAETNTFSKDFNKNSLYKLIENGSPSDFDEGIDHFFESHESDYGKVRHLAPALQMSETQPFWAFGPRPLGSDSAKWI